MSGPFPPPVCSQGRGAAVAVMAKQPVAGHVKTRLSPPLTPAEAAGLSQCFLLDTLENVRRLSGVARFVAFSPIDAADFFRACTGGVFGLLPQTRGDLGQRLAALTERIFAAGFSTAVIIGTDAPTLPNAYLLEAIHVLVRDGADVVLGPADDGGYYLVGLRGPASSLFQDIAWSTAEVLRQTLDRVRTVGLRPYLLPSWFDVDTEPDLRRLARDLATHRTQARHTRAYLRALHLL